MNLLDEKIKLEKTPEIIPKAVTPKKESPPPINLNEIFKKKEELKNDDSSSSYQNEIENLEKFEEPEPKSKIEPFIEKIMPEEDFSVNN